MRLAALVFAMLMLAGSPGRAAEFETVTLANGTDLTYAVALPENFEPAASHPVLLALPPGGQTVDMVNAGLNAYWEDEGRRRGFIVISPAAPPGEGFMGPGRRHLPLFLDHIRATYRIAGKFHLAGVSNGGLSAFAIAVAQPDAFQTLTVIPGVPPTREDFDALSALKNMKVNLIVGENDGGWRQSMDAAYEELRRLHIDTDLQVVPAEGHFVRSLTGPASALIFDRILR